MSKIVIGFTEKIKINNKFILARIDTGAEYNSISKELADKLKLGPIVKHVRIRTSNGEERRPVIEAEIKIKNKKIKTLFNITDRKKMTYSILIGRKVLRKGFVIDPSK
jgi:hypothetical protein